eukprot:scaffold50201_cov50-Attheya_sp.AAC.4
MRVLLIAVGSRGDAEPFCSLAVSLAGSDQVDTVDLFLQKDLKHLVPNNTHQGDETLDKIHYHELPFTQMDFYKYVGARSPPQAGAGHANPRVQFLGIVTDIMGELVLPCYTDVKKTTMEGKAVDAIVASSLARQLAMEVAGQMEKKTPVYLVQLQSIVPTKDFPHYSKQEECINALVHQTGDNSSDNLESFLELERLQHDFLKVHANDKLSDLPNYKKEQALDLDFDQDVVPALTGHDTQRLDLWMVNAVSTHLIPPPSDAGSKVLNCGGLADAYIPSNFEPPADLVSFLDSLGNKRPICFGYGSMPFGKAELVMEALFEVDSPAILVGSAMMGILDKLQPQQKESSDEQTSWIQENIHCVASIPYAWLLARCSMMFSHGGAGVVHATLRAGIPALISPLMGDQFLFAQYLQAKGLGVQASGNLGALTKEDILRSIQAAESCQEACRALGEEMAKGEPAGTNSSKFGPDILTDAIVSHGCPTEGRCRVQPVSTGWNTVTNPDRIKNVLARFDLDVQTLSSS